jgi:hypothetical protein
MATGPLLEFASFSGRASGNNRRTSALLPQHLCGVILQGKPACLASLVGFRHPGDYADLLIKPSRKTFDALIVKEWPNIQRILASLAQKDVTQATVVRKLSSYTRQNQTKKALWELDNIRRTIHILDFIDDPRTSPPRCHRCRAAPAGRFGFAWRRSARQSRARSKGRHSPTFRELLAGRRRSSCRRLGRRYRYP